MRRILSFGISLLLIGGLWVGWGNWVWAVSQEQEVQIEKVGVQFLSEGSIVLLQVGERAIPILVDSTVAGSIHGALAGRKFSRPLSHDLMHTILKNYEVRVERVFITLRDGVFYGTLTLSQNGNLQLFDSRSSDAIALGVHFQSPIIVEKSLLESAGKPLVTYEGSMGLELL